MDSQTTDKNEPTPSDRQRQDVAHLLRSLAKVAASQDGWVVVRSLVAGSCRATVPEQELAAVLLDCHMDGYTRVSMNDLRALVSAAARLGKPWAPLLAPIPGGAEFLTPGGLPWSASVKQITD